MPRKASTKTKPKPNFTKAATHAIWDSFVSSGALPKKMAMKMKRKK